LDLLAVQGSQRVGLDLETEQQQDERGEDPDAGKD